MWPPKLRPSLSIGRRVMAFRIYFQHGCRPPFWILKMLIFDFMTVIVVLTCCCVPNFIKIGSCVRHPDANNGWMFDITLLGNGHCHGNRITAHISGTWWDATTQVLSKSVHWQASYSVSNILQYGGRPPSWTWILLFWTTHEVNYAVRLPCHRVQTMTKWSYRAMLKPGHCPPAMPGQLGVCEGVYSKSISDGGWPTFHTSKLICKEFTSLIP